MKYFTLLLFFVFSISGFSQKIEKEGKVYDVKNEKIYLNGKDITQTLHPEHKDAILEQAQAINAKNKAKKDTEKETKKLEKEKKKAEKGQKKAEKAQKKAEKALKKSEKLQKNYKKAQDHLKKAQKKYEKLKKKGKLSPVDEAKWLDKIEKLTQKVDKAKGKL
ncbi:hypothetical protein [Winogradskyella sp. J14-2]|uniref:hypothetical protein n=1 Tax=Winogradskyella sp. J14-2 TaxID=1936080 RepID=UPI0012FC52BB|nr:hypothetical protein [Winogradskyella sp. J14-2]